MELRYLRFDAFRRMMRPFSAHQRRKRMLAFASRLKLAQGMSVLDLGGQPDTWRDFFPALDIVVLNLPGVANRVDSSHHRFTYVEGDGCAVNGFADRSFDLVFSNSVIEHVGDDSKQQDFAREVRRLGRAYWVQTPAAWFPIEAHCGMPFWWFYPDRLRRHFLKRWKLTLPAWTEMVEGTRVLSKSRMRALFPEARIYVERYCGIPKSYVAWHVGK